MRIGRVGGRRKPLSKFNTRNVAVARARNEFLTTGRSQDKNVSVAVTASWQRSVAAGVDANKARAAYHDDLDVSGRLMRCSSATIQRLRDQTADMPLSIVLADGKARILSRCDTDSAIGRRFEAVLLAPGFNYAEGSVGTNGIGTVFESGRPVSIVGPEHFGEQLQAFACFSSPIRDPLTGRIEGALDISCLVEDATPLMGALVVTAAHAIEHDLLMDRGQCHQALFDAFVRLDARTRGAVVAVSDTVVMSNGVMQRMFDLAEQVAITEHARSMMSRRNRAEEHVVLTSGTVVRIRGSRIAVGAEVAGVVVIADTLSEFAGSRPPPEAIPGRSEDPTARADDAADGYHTGVEPLAFSTAGCSVWERASNTMAESFARGGALLVMGEVGSGKATLVVDIFARVHPRGRVVVVNACDVDLVAAGGMGMMEVAADGGGLLYVFKNIDQLTTTGVGGLAEVITILTALGPSVSIVATVDDQGIEAKRPFISILPYFHSSVVVPPLRHRMSDLPRVVSAILARTSDGCAVSVGPAAMRVLSRHTWPRNLHQLEEALVSALQRRPVGEIQAEDLPGTCHSSPRRQLSSIEAMERDCIVAALSGAGGNRVQAAKTLGIARSSLYRKIKLFSITAI